MCASPGASPKLPLRGWNLCCGVAPTAAPSWPCWRPGRPGQWRLRHHRRGVDPTRIAVVLGTGIGGLATMHEQHSQLSEGGPSRVNPLTVPMLIPDAAAGQVAIDLGLQGGAHTPVSACASGAEALMLAQWLLQDDRADLVLAGGSEAPVNRLGLVGFSAMRALSLRNEAPEQASRPYGQERDGFVLSEGAGMLALMRQSDVPAGDALGWLLASGSSSDAHHIVAPEPQGLQASRAIEEALRRADCGPNDLCAVQAHATGTSLGDLAEARALRRSLGSAADHLPVYAPKGQLGHLLGGAGAVETILALQSLRAGLVPCSMNSDPLDPAVELAVTGVGPVPCPTPTVNGSCSRTPSASVATTSAWCWRHRLSRALGSSRSAPLW